MGDAAAAPEGACDPGAARTPSPRTRAALDWLNFFLADVQTGVGPFLAIYLIGQGQGWDEQRVGLVLTVGGLAGIATQTPAGALVDRSRAKRALLAAAVAALAVGALLIAAWPAFWPVLAAQVLIGGISSLFIPLICAISLGLVGMAGFDRRQGRNQTFNAAGNVVAALAMGLIGYFLSDRGIFFFVVAFTVPTLVCLRRIAAREIDHDLARNARADAAGAAPARITDLLRDRPLLVFLAAAVLFHFANAAILPLLGEKLAKGTGHASMAFMSACVITTQVVVTALASWSGRAAGAWGRKPLLLIAFAALPLRGVLYTLTDDTALLVAVQLLDGVAAAIFGVVSALVVADLTRGTGRFNLAQGAIATAVGIGASLSQVIAGAIVHRAGFHAGFLFLAAVAAGALALLWVAMPETRAAGRPAAAPA